MHTNACHTTVLFRPLKTCVLQNIRSLSKWVLCAEATVIAIAGWSYLSAAEEPILRGHFKEAESAVVALAISPDNRTLAAGCDDGTIKIWDTRTRNLRLTFRHQNAPVRIVAFSTDSKLIATACEGTLNLWDAVEGKLRCTFEVGNLTNVAWSPNGKSIATLNADFDQPPRLWDAVEKRLSIALRHPRGTWPSVSWAAIAFTADGESLALASSGDAPRFWNSATGNLDSTFQGRNFQDENGEVHARSPTCLRLSPDGKTLAMGTWQFDVLVWDVPTSKGPRMFRVDDVVACIAFRPESNSLAVAKSRGVDCLPPEVAIWDLATLKPVRILQPAPIQVKLNPTGGFLAQALSDDGKLWVTASADNSIQLWELDTRRAISSLRVPITPTEIGSKLIEGQCIIDVSLFGAKRDQLPRQGDRNVLE